jgi:multiple sugar transport system permease protein
MSVLKKNSYYIKLMIPGTIFLIIVILAPIISTFVMSLQSYNFTRPSAKSWIGLKNYADIFTDSLFWESIWHTVVYTVVAVASEFFLGLLIALLFYRISKENSPLMSLFILPSVISPVVVGLIFRYMLNTEFGYFTYLLNKVGLFKNIALLGNVKTALGSVIAADIWQWTPFLALMLLSGMITLPQEPFEAAKVDGASQLDTLIHIMLPLLKPVIRVSLMLRIADAVKEFDKLFVMTEGGPGTASETLNYLSYRINFRYFQMGRGSALVFIILIFIILLSIVVLRTLSVKEDIY